jgi:hypothetical protein
VSNNRRPAPLAKSFQAKFSNCKSAPLRNQLHVHSTMKLSTHSAVPVYTVSGSSTARPLPDWLARKRKRSLKQDPEFANRVELLQDFEFEEASSCVRVSEDGDWVMSTGESPFCCEAIRRSLSKLYLRNMLTSISRNL